jgi:hypothetical protein
MGYNETPIKGNTMTIKSALSSIGNGALSAATAIHNASISTEIEELDKQITELVEKRVELEKKLIK